MARKVAVSTLNATTLDILNVIRQNASREYQDLVPKVNNFNDIPKVGEVLLGYPALANQFLNALITRIASVQVKSSLFNNPYAALKKGYIEFGETIEEVFVSIIKARVHSAEKAEAREFKRNLPQVNTVFHAKNWEVQYPVTIQDTDLRTAFLSIDGVTDLITKIVDTLYTSANYDEFLLFKYLIIKAITSGKMKPVEAGRTTSANAVSFRGISNAITFMSKDYNEYGVTTQTPKDRQIIFMDAMYNADFDVNVLAGAFNMEKADFMGRLHLIDSWTTFDNDRFSDIMAESDILEPVTEEELTLMADVKAVLVDSDWFQVYDNNIMFTEKYVSAGLYWNYILHNWKTFSHSPFANAVVFTTALPAAITEFTVEVIGKDVDEIATVFTLGVKPNPDNANFRGGRYEFVQSEDATAAAVAVQKYGAVVFGKCSTKTQIDLYIVSDGALWKSTTALTTAANVGDTFTMQLDS